MAVKLVVILDVEPTPDLDAKVRSSLELIGPAEVFVTDDDDEFASEDGSDAEEELDPEADEGASPGLEEDESVCPTCGQALLEDPEDQEENVDG